MSQAGEKLNTKQTTWDFSPLFISDNDSAISQSREAAIQAVNKFVKKWHKRTDYLENIIVLKTVLDEYEKLFRNLGTDDKEGYYYQLRFAQNQLDPVIKGQLTQATNTSLKLHNQLQFFELNLARVSPKLQKQFIQSSELIEYKHFLERIFAQAKHLLSEPEEKILTLKSQTSYANWVRMTEGFLSNEELEVLDENGKKQNKNISELLGLMNNQKKKVRDASGQAFNQLMQKYSDVAEVEMNSVLANKQTDDLLRNFAKPEDSRILSDDYDNQIVETLIQSVSSHFAISAKYYQLKAKLMGQTELEYHERNVEYGTIKTNFSYQDSVDLVFKVFSNLDAEFGEIFINFVEKGQIDVYPKKGKSSGAFCAYGLITYPTYILLNHNNLLNDCLTIAHESGHGINDELMKKQNSLNFGTPLSIAEVSSTFMEDFCLEEILTKATDEEKLSIMMTKLNSDISTIFRQIACFTFERELHQRFRETGYVSKDEIGKLFQKHMASYMGKYVEQSPGSENWWVYWHHIRNYFYNYSYANGLLISKALQNLVRADRANISKVKKMLSTGLSESPKEMFKSIGIDVVSREFWETGIKEISGLLSQTEKLAKKLKKI